MDKLIQVEILTPENVIYRGKVKSITLPGVMGSFQVLYNHAPLISILEVGRVKIVEETGNALYFVISNGFAEVKNNVVSVFVDSAEQVEKSKVADLLKEKRKEIFSKDVF
ncbi:MAG: ATP synthase F1 subunit epsilon [Candidatus Kryptonium sp.]|nr:ATP synthase F1 subunit epsilon [Candidatus Kryptonium sp.]MCX7762862.1 ATP synthase F1 subunit epsilon [Candidatus Kryptonium sp.]MDW8109470.1 ATP synthase F1 subunit epsilon [Candidatus Kryptonium sp.]